MDADKPQVTIIRQQKEIRNMAEDKKPKDSPQDEPEQPKPKPQPPPQPTPGEGDPLNPGK